MPTLQVVEHISSVYSYHLQLTTEKPFRSLCGKPTFATRLPYEYWRQTPANYHIPEKWCTQCEKIAKGMK